MIETLCHMIESVTHDCFYFYSYIISQEWQAELLLL